MKHVWSVLCRNYIIDEQSKNLSLIDLPNRLSFKGDLPEKRPFEVPLPSEFYFLSKWIGDSGDNDERRSALVLVVDPSGEEIGKFDFEFDMRPTSVHVSIGTVSSMLFTENGLYFFEVFLRDNDKLSAVASIPFELVHEDSNSEPQESEPTE